MADPDWLKLSRECYESSTSYIDAHYREEWDAAIRAFHSQHPTGSKYLSDPFKHRSKGFSPKTRSVIRKNEAAAAVALFSNFDVVSVDPVDPQNPTSVASAAVGKELLQHRLTKTIPWFKLVIGSLQDAQTVGVVISYQYWEYKTRADEMGVIVIKDSPCVELRPVENIRFSEAADWLDPLNTSPFLIDDIPMFAVDVKRCMDSENTKTGDPKWKKHDDALLRQAMTRDTDSTAMEREPTRADRFADGDKTVGDYEIVWVRRNLLRTAEGEFCYYTLKDVAMLSDPVPCAQVYPHLPEGERPYVMGMVVIESHKTLPAGIAALARPLQTESNEIRNERRDNVKLVLNKRWFVARGKQVDVESLVRNVPGGVTLMNDTQMDAREVNWPDVTGSAFMEQDRVNVELDELVGNFSGGSVQSNRSLNETVGGMRMLNQSASLMTEYLLWTWRETWCEPVLRQLLKLEQYYESDLNVLALAAQKAQLWQKFGMNAVTDEMLRSDLTLTLNVGMGATNPSERVGKLVAAVQTVGALAEKSPPGMNIAEISKEVFGAAGYRDGTRFYSPQPNPQLAQAMQLIQQLQGELKSQQQATMIDAQIKTQKNNQDFSIAQEQVQNDRTRIHGDLQLRAAELELNAAAQEVEQMRLVAESQNAGQERMLRIAEMQNTIEESRERVSNERARVALDRDRAVSDADGKAEDRKIKRGELGLKARDFMVKNTPQLEAERVSESVSRSVAGILDELRAIREGDPIVSQEAIKANGELVGAHIRRKSGKEERVAIRMQ